MNRIATTVVSLILLANIASAQRIQGWDDIFGPIDAPDGDIKAIAVDGNSVYIGGNFIHVGARPITSMAAFTLNGREWAPLCDGMTGSTTAIATTAEEVVMAGRFRFPGDDSTYGLIFRNKDGGECRPGVFTRLNNQTDIFDLHVVGSDLFIGGNFALSGDSALRGIVRFDTRTRTYHALGSGVRGTVGSMDRIGDSLFIGGSITLAGGKPAHGVAIWNLRENQWENAPLGLTGSVMTVKRWGRRMLVSGNKVTSGNGWATHSAFIEPGRDSVVALRIPHVDTAFIRVSATAIVGGKIMFATDVAITDMVTWDTATGAIEVPGGGIGGDVHLLVEAGGRVYAGGMFQRAGGRTASNVAVYDTSSRRWSAILGRPYYGLSGIGNLPIVRALAPGRGAQMYVGGFFSIAGSLYNYGSIGLWTGTDWRRLGQGLLGDVRTISTIGDTSIVAGGSIRSTQNPYLNLGNIGRWSWNDSSWHALGAGFDAVVSATAVGPDGAIYAGGPFTLCGTTRIEGLGVWRNDRWVPVIPQLSGVVTALRLVDNRLHIGGDFYMSAGDSTTRTFCILDLGTGDVTVPDPAGAVEAVMITAIDVSAGRVFAGGAFSNRATSEGSSVAELVEDQWVPLGETPAGTPYALVASNGGVVVGGDMRLDGGPQIANLGFWDGERWTAVEGGTENDVYALALTDSFLYVGGGFLTTGGIYSPALSRWRHDNFRGLVTAVRESIDGRTGRIIAISPNPARDILRVSIDASSATELRIFDAMGRLRARHSVPGRNKAALDISGLEPGVYLLVSQAGMRTGFVVAR